MFLQDLALYYLIRRYLYIPLPPKYISAQCIRSIHSRNVHSTYAMINFTFCFRSRSSSATFSRCAKNRLSRICINISTICSCRFTTFLSFSRACFCIAIRRCNRRICILILLLTNTDCHFFLVSKYM